MIMHICFTEVIMDQETLSGFKDIWLDSVNIDKQIQEMTDLKIGYIFTSYNKEF